MVLRRAVLLGFTLSIALLGLPLAGSAQEAEEEDPEVLRISFFKCNLGGGNGDRIAEEIETRDMPIWNALVDEGLVEQYGYFYHWWADEWNVGIYTIGESIQAIVDANDEAGNRTEAQYGDAPTAFEQACPEHRDGFYTVGPSTEDDEPDASGGS